jgi:hypothetical protein
MDNQNDLVRILVGDYITQNIIATNEENRRLIETFRQVQLVLFEARHLEEILLSKGMFDDGSLSVHVITRYPMYSIPIEMHDIRFDMLLTVEIKLGWCTVASLKETRRVALYMSRVNQDSDDMVLNIIVGDDSRSVVLTIELVGFSQNEITSLKDRVISFTASQQTYDSVMTNSCALLKEICKRYGEKNIYIRRISFRLKAVHTFIDSMSVVDDDDDDDDHADFLSTYMLGLMKDSNSIAYSLRVAETINAPSPGVVIE